MRVDVYLHKVCLTKSRSMAGEACDRGRVWIDDAPARASRLLRPGQRVRLDLGAGVLEIEVVAIPEGNVSRASSHEYYRVLKDERGARPEL